MQSIDFSHLQYAVMEVYGVTWMCDADAVEFAKEDMPEQLRPALMCRDMLTAIYKQLIKAIEMTAPYRRLDQSVTDRIDKIAVKRQMYQPADKWDGHFSATSAAVDCLRCFFGLSKRKGWRADELSLIRGKLIEWNPADCWENHDLLQSAIDEVVDPMQRWSKLHPLKMHLLNRAIKVEGSLFSLDPPIGVEGLLRAPSIENASQGESQIQAVWEPIEITAEEQLFLTAAVQLDAGKVIVPTDDIKRAAKADGTQRHVRESLRKKGLIKSGKGMQGVMVTAKGMEVYEKQCAHC